MDAETGSKWTYDNVLKQATNKQRERRLMVLHLTERLIEMCAGDISAFVADKMYSITLSIFVMDTGWDHAQIPIEEIQACAKKMGWRFWTTTTEGNDSYITWCHIQPACAPK